MTALTISSATPSSDADIVYGIAGEAIGVGQAVHFNRADGKYYLADADNANRRNLVGIALTTSGANAPVAVQTGGEITLGTTMTPGEVYVAGDAAGAIHPVGDLAAGWGIMFLGVAKTATLLKLTVVATGVVK